MPNFLCQLFLLHERIVRIYVIYTLLGIDEYLYSSGVLHVISCLWLQRGGTDNKIL